MKALVIVDAPIYSQMCTAIAESENLDEAKEIRTRAMMLEVYGKQANNIEAEGLCINIRLRAERKVGEILNNTESQESTKGKNSTLLHTDAVLTPKQLARDQAGISRSLGDRCQRLADIPEDDFNEAINDPDSKPSRDGILKKLRPVNEIRGNPLAMDAWGMLTDFEGKLETTPLKKLLPDMRAGMLVDCERLIPRLIKWLENGL
jgi:hypothetical protein